MKALVTGGGGFVGFAIVKMLRGRGDDVRTIARGDYPRITALGGEQVRADLTDAKAVKDACDGVDVVVHVAAKTGMWGDAAEYERANVTATQNVLDACVSRGVGRLVLTSSPSITFNGDAEGADETLPYAPKHLYDYGRTKAEAERRVLLANATPHKHGTGVVLTCALRPHLVYGEEDTHFLPRAISRAKAGRFAFIGRPTTKIDVTHVDNAAHAHLLAIDALGTDNPRCAGKPYFISQGTPVSPEAWLNRILRDVGLDEVTRRVPLAVAYGAGAFFEALWSVFKLKGDPVLTRFTAVGIGSSHWYDLSNARRDLGYETIVDDEEAHRRTVAWLKDEIAAGRL